MEIICGSAREQNSQIGDFGKNPKGGNVKESMANSSLSEKL
jgi:hypothetical protein